MLTHFNEYTERDAQRDMDATEKANAPYIADWARDGRPQRCDGGGIIDEWYIDVDQTHVVRCPGCPACDLVADAAIAAEPDIDQATRRAPISAVPAHLCYHKWAFEKEVA